MRRTASLWTSQAKKSPINEKNSVIRNGLGVPLIPPSLHHKLFGSPQQACRINKEALQKAHEHLKNFKIEIQANDAPIDVTYLQNLEDLKIKHNDISKHFRSIGEEQVEPFVKVINHVISQNEVPPMPKSWAFQEGWTRYDPKTGKSEPVACPEEELLFFDIENCVREGPWPTLAAALSPNAWYSWCSPYLIDITKKPADRQCLSPKDLISIGNPLLVIGHNVSFDRARIAEQYYLELSRTRFLDTMSLHIAVCGMTSSQRKQKLKEKSSEMAHSPIPWSKKTSMNSLNDLAQFYLKESLKKDTRDVFVKGSLEDIVQDFQRLMKYCASDVRVTRQVFDKVFVKFSQHCPHPITLSGNHL